jgi:DNA-binding response OmpR family regulator
MNIPVNNPETSIQDPSGQAVTGPYRADNGWRVAKIFVVCNQRDMAPVWGYILRQQGLIVILETFLERVIDRWSTEMPDLVVLDLTVNHNERMEVYERFRAVSQAPILLLLPTYHEIEILESYQAGVDDVIIKPISPPIFLAKIMAWVRRSWTMPMNSLNTIEAGDHRLDPSRRCLVQPSGEEVRLTNLEFHLLHLLMSRSGRVFSMEEIIDSIWGGFGEGDQVLLKNVVYRLRRKIETDPSHPVLLQTWPSGYSFQG